MSASAVSPVPSFPKPGVLRITGTPEHPVFSIDGYGLPVVEMVRLVPPRQSVQELHDIHGPKMYVYGGVRPGFVTLTLMTEAIETGGLPVPEPTRYTRGGLDL